MKKAVSRREYLDECVRKVEHYKPLIEERTGTDLGEVDVHDLMFIPVHLTKNFLLESLAEGYVEENRMMPFLAPVFSPVAFAVAVGALFYNWNALSSYANSSIFFNTRKKRRLEVLDDEIGIDRGAVHELGHHLWHVLDGDPARSSDNPRLPMINEGFATYCERTWFADLYPVQKKLNYADLWGAHDYQAGGLRMIRFVQEHGEEILLQVPSKWRELDERTALLAQEVMASSKAQIDAFKGEVDLTLD